MKIIEFWDKKSPVNGVSAEELLKDNFFKNARRLFLIKDDITGIVSNIESVDVIKSNLEMNASDEEVAQAYLDSMMIQPMMAMSAEPTISDLQNQINKLSTKIDMILEKLN